MRLIFAFAALALLRAASPARADDYNDCQYLGYGPDKAIAGCTRAIRAWPKNKDMIGDIGVLYHDRGDAYADKQDYDHAIADFTQAIRVSPGESYVRYSRGLAYAGEHNYDRAIADFDQSIKLYAREDHRDAPSTLDTYYRALADAYDAKGDRDRAFQTYASAIELLPTSGVLRLGRGDIHAKGGDLDRALADYDQAIKVDPTNIDVHLNRAIVLEKLNRLKEARDDFQRYYEMSNDERGKTEAERLSREIAAAPTPPTPVAAPTPPSAPTAPKPAPTPAAAAIAPAPSPAHHERRVALVIGNSAYAVVPALSNPERDSKSVAEALRADGFQVDLLVNATRQQMIAALQAFDQAASSSDWALIYFAGHGIEDGGRNFVVPVDAKIEARSHIVDETVDLDRLESAVEGAKRLRLVLLDACRSDPFVARMAPDPGRPRAIDRGLAPAEPSPGTMIVYATRAGATASDGNGLHSPFTTAFLKEIAVPGLEVRRLFDYVRDDVLEATSQDQQPFSYGSLPAREDYYFRTAAK